MSFRFRPVDGQGDGLVAGINPTPLVDVMLVLLIIFLITLPVVTHSLAVRLPAQAAAPSQPQPRSVAISITRGGELHWNQGRVRDLAQLSAMLRALGAQSPRSQVFLHGDAELSYEHVGAVLRACREAGLTNLSFVTQPAGGQGLGP